MSPPTRPFVPRANRVDINHEFASVEDFISEYVSNISSSGVFIRSKDPLPVGTKVNLKFTVLMDDIETIEGVGQVVRVSERPKGMGVVFTHLTEHSKDLLAKLLTRRMAQPPRRESVVREPEGVALRQRGGRGADREDGEGRASLVGAGVRASARPSVSDGPMVVPPGTGRSGAVPPPVRDGRRAVPPPLPEDVRATPPVRRAVPPPLPEDRRTAPPVAERSRRVAPPPVPAAAQEPTVVRDPPLEAFTRDDMPTQVSRSGEGSNTGARRRAVPPPPPPPKRKRH